MDYKELSYEFLQMMYKHYQIKAQQKFSNAVHGEAFALQYIAQHDDAAVPSDIENAMSVSSARIATLLGRLEDKGWITRRIDPKDRRRTILKLTSKGEEKAKKSEQELLSLVTKMLEYLGEEDARNYMRIVGKISSMCSNEFD